MARVDKRRFVCDRALMHATARLSLFTAEAKTAAGRRRESWQGWNYKNIFEFGEINTWMREIEKT